MVSDEEEEMDNRQRFAEEYTKALAECVADSKNGYIYGLDQVPEVARKMIAATFDGSAHYSGAAYKLACKRLGIKYTKKAIIAFISLQETKP